MSIYSEKDFKWFILLNRMMSILNIIIFLMSIDHWKASMKKSVLFSSVRFISLFKSWILKNATQSNSDYLFSILPKIILFASFVLAIPNGYYTFISLDLNNFLWFETKWSHFLYFLTTPILILQHNIFCRLSPCKDYFCK